MIIISDSGSTKTHWRLLHDSQKTDIITTGINPYFQTSEEIAQCIAQELLPQVKQQPTHVFFYGAGCANNEKISDVRQAIEQNFPSATLIVESDMLGAARATLQHTAGIACILGTGSNSCFYDGTTITHNVSAGGFILGDEGSGAVIGKMLMADYVKNQMPQHLRGKLEEKTCVAEVIEHVYRRPFPNRYLAQFTRFVAENIEEDYCKNLTTTAFAAFFNRNIKQYANWDSHKIHFIGSIAHFFKEQLLSAANACGCSVGTISQDPIDGIENYHKIT